MDTRAGHNLSGDLRRAWARLAERAGEPVDVASLAAFRFFFGSILAVSALRFLAYGWVDSLLLGPRFRFKYWGFEWVAPLPPDLMHALFVGLVVAGAFVAVGFLYRLSALLLALGFTYFQLLDVSNYLNHYYLAALLAWLCVLLPLGRSLSVDAWVRVQRGGQPFAETLPRLALWLLRAQIGIVYFFAGIAKAQPDWLLHAQPLRIWLSARAELPLLGELVRLPWVPLAFSWAGFLFDTTIVAFLLWKRTRLAAFLVVVVFHAMTRLLFPIGMFPVIMVVSVLVFFEPSWPREALTKLWPRFPAGLRAKIPGSLREAPPISRKNSAPLRWYLALAAGYLALQVAVPLRAFVYPGNVLWHEQGMRFSFRVMLRAKGGQTTFLVWSKGREKPFVVSPRRYLNAFQESEMSSQPDLILQLAHHIREDFEAQGYQGVRVHADARVALNGRRSALLVDPTVDLSRIRDGLAPVSYVLPAPSGPPPLTLPTF